MEKFEKTNYYVEKEDILSEGRLMLLIRQLRLEINDNRISISDIQNSINKINSIDVELDNRVECKEPNCMLDELSILIDELRYLNKILESNSANLKSIV